MSLSLLANRSVQQEVLPTMMNNRGNWDINTFYYKSDTVVSPLGNLAIAMIAQSGNDPDTTNPNPWLVVNGGGGGGSQTLSFDVSGVALSISNGNTVSINAPQLLDISGSALSITRGNTITLPTSLVQDLSYNSVSYNLSITGGNSVSLSNLIQDLSFNPITKFLSITNGNSVFIDISGGSGTASNWATYPAITTIDANQQEIVNLNGCLLTNPTQNQGYDYYIANASNAMVQSAFFLERDRQVSQGNPVGANGVIESHWYKEDINPANNQDFAFRIVHNGQSTYLRTAWEIPNGTVEPPVYTMGTTEIQGVPVSVATNQGGGAGFIIKSTAQGWTNLYSDSNGDLYANATSNAGSNWGTAVPLTSVGSNLRSQLVNQSLCVVSPLSNVLMPSNYNYALYSQTFSNWTSSPTDAFLNITMCGTIAGSNGSGTPHDVGFLTFQYAKNLDPFANMDNPGGSFPCLPIAGNNNIGSWCISASQRIPGLTNSDSVSVQVLLTTSSALLFSNAEYTSSSSPAFFGLLTPI